MTMHWPCHDLGVVTARALTKEQNSLLAKATNQPKAMNLSSTIKPRHTIKQY